MTYPAHHEGIAGEQRDGDPLLMLEAAPLVARLALAIHRAVQVGDPAPTVQMMLSRMRSPRIGDPVVVFDAIVSRFRDRQYRGTGYLLAVRPEWGDTDEEWEQTKRDEGLEDDRERFVERDVWYIQYGPEAGDVCRWVNCTVLAIPQEIS